MDVSPTDVSSRTKRTALAWKLDGPLFSSLEELHEKLAELLGKQDHCVDSLLYQPIAGYLHQHFPLLLGILVVSYFMSVVICILYGCDSSALLEVTFAHGIGVFFL